MEQFKRCHWCQTRASGMWLVIPTEPNHVPFFALGCAQHGLTEIMLMRDMWGNLRYRRVHLVQSFNTEFIQSDAPAQIGAKHWVDTSPEKQPPARIQFALSKLKEIRRGSGSTVAESILAQYRR